MPLETATFLSELNAANPVGASDPVSTADDHLRLLKSVLKATFPGLAGRAFRVQAKATGFSVVANDNTSLFNCTAALTVSPVAAATLGNGHHFAVFANGAAATIDPNGAETINGATTLAVPSGSLALVWCNGTAFFAIVITDPAALQASLDAKATVASLSAHTGDTANPHAVTKAQVGLGSVDNTADADKPVSTAQQTALDAKVAKAGDTMTGDLVLADVAAGAGRSAGFRGTPVVTVNAARTIGPADSGKRLFHNEATARVWTIDAALTYNDDPVIIIDNTGNSGAAGALTIAITGGTLRRGDGTAGTGSRTVPASGVAAIARTSGTNWVITGSFS